MNELGNTPADKNYKPSGISKAEARIMEKQYNLGYKRGYELAEKDLALTWEDLELLHRLFAEEEDNFSKHDKYFYAEALTRFKQFKED